MDLSASSRRMMGGGNARRGAIAEDGQDARRCPTFFLGHLRHFGHLRRPNIRAFPYQQKMRTQDWRPREDLMNLLGVIRDRGRAGVSEGLKKGAFLPGLVG